MSTDPNSEFDDAISKARAAKAAARFKDCIEEADRALAARPGACYAASLRIWGMRKQGEASARRASHWAEEWSDQCQWSNYFRAEQAWSYYDGWLKLDGEPQVVGQKFTHARDAFHRILELTKPVADQFVRARSTIRFLSLASRAASRDSDWLEIVRITEQVGPEEFDREPPQVTEHHGIPESDYEKWVRARVRALRHVGRQSDAVDLANEVKGEYPANIWLDRELGLSECSAGQFAAGAKRLERIFAGKPDYYIAGEVGDCFHQAGDLERAAHWYSRAASRSSPVFAVNVIHKMAGVLEQLGRVQDAYQQMLLVWAVAADQRWDARAIRARNDLAELVSRHAADLPGVPQDLNQAPRTHDALRLSRPIWDHWTAWKPVGMITGSISSYNLASCVGRLTAAGKTYEFKRIDFESAVDPSFGQSVRFIAEEGNDGKLLARQVCPT